MDGLVADKAVMPAAAIASSQLDPSSARFDSSDVQRASSPTIFEPTPLVESKMPLASPVSSGELASIELVAAKNSIGASSGDLSNNISHNFRNPPLTDAQGAAVEPQIASPANVINQDSRPAPSETLVTPLPPFGRVPDYEHTPGAFNDIWSRNRRTILQSVALIVLAALLVVIVMWLISKARQKGVGGDASVQSVPVVSKPQAEQQAPSASQGNPAAITVPDGMVYVPGGRFKMGRSNGDEYERPAHTVEVEPFFIDRTEVRNEQYQRFVTETNHRAPTHWQNGSFVSAEAKMPVVNVSWDDATAYARWAGNRLPTEAEWEFAARGTDGRLYAWGNTWNAAASNAGHGNGGHIIEVGRFPAGVSPFGAVDMCGNVWEWSASSLQSYAEGHQEIAPGKVIRGGAFDVPSDRATATYRGVLPADRLRDKTGFRTVRSVK
ncbi:MAG: SUMF1/EgtB/PvdO family nonheme iron enzyme [Blastocatellia bacterium]